MKVLFLILLLFFGSDLSATMIEQITITPDPVFNYYFTWMMHIAVSMTLFFILVAFLI